MIMTVYCRDSRVQLLQTFGFSRSLTNCVSGLNSLWRPEIAQHDRGISETACSEAPGPPTRRLSTVNWAQDGRAGRWTPEPADLNRHQNPEFIFCKKQLMWSETDSPNKDVMIYINQSESQVWINTVLTLIYCLLSVVIDAKKYLIISLQTQ